MSNSATCPPQNKAGKVTHGSRSRDLILKYANLQVLANTWESRNAITVCPVIIRVDACTCLWRCHGERSRDKVVLCSHVCFYFRHGAHKASHRRRICGIRAKRDCKRLHVPRGNSAYSVCAQAVNLVATCLDKTVVRVRIKHDADNTRSSVRLHVVSVIGESGTNSEVSVISDCRDCACFPRYRNTISDKKFIGEKRTNPNHSGRCRRVNAP